MSRRRDAVRVENLRLQARSHATGAFVDVAARYETDLAKWMAFGMGQCFELGRRSMKDLKCDDEEFQIFTQEYFDTLMRHLKESGIIA